MNMARLLRAELRKLATTRMPLAFLAVLVAIGAVNAAAVIWGTDFDGSKTFISTAADQRSLVAFGSNAVIVAGLFGAIAVAREYGHGTVIPTFLSSPRRHRAVLAQYGAVAIGGALIGLVGAATVVAAVALALTTTEFSFMISAAGVGRVLAASTFAGAAGAVLGAGIGSIVRNAGGAVTGTVLALIIAPPLIVQLIDDASSWVPAPLAIAMAGVDADVASVPTDANAVAAMAALAGWALVPALIGLLSVQRRDVV
ncbi:MAG: ABC transporter permease subunit [Acidimicrobiia bacterium]|nr:ABC transporter permease subunit [Acidimicrobiia bacterium]